MEEVWSVEQRAPFLTSALTTGGGLVFMGDYDRWIRAYDVATGESLWETRLATAVQGYPMSYEVDGVQYIAVPTGVIAEARGTSRDSWHPRSAFRRATGTTPCMCFA